MDDLVTMAVLGLSPVTAGIAAFAGLVGIVGTLGVCVVWMRRSISTERDTARVNTLAAVRELAEVNGQISDAHIAECNHWIDRLERHHDVTHRRCVTAPQRDG